MVELKGTPESGNTLAEIEGDGTDNCMDCMCMGRMRHVRGEMQARGETQAAGAE
jgi:hypothetical protein